VYFLRFYPLPVYQVGITKGHSAVRIFHAVIRYFSIGAGNGDNVLLLEKVMPAAKEPGNVRLPFGKHRGEQIRNVPVGYLDWVLGVDLTGYPNLEDNIKAYLKTQAEYDKEPKDWKEGREDYNPDEDD
jgi:hypothetical protein